jgi:hypothetical protein
MRSPYVLLSALALASTVLLAAGCATKPDVRFDQDPAADLRAYTTFAFFEPLAADGQRYTSLLASRLKQATREQLERQGYVYREGNPDLRVNIALRVAEKQELQGWRTGYRGWASHADINDYRVGTLMIDLVDARRQALVWQGVIAGRLTEQTIKEPGPAIEKAVAEVFAGFPAGSGKTAAVN